MVPDQLWAVDVMAIPENVETAIEAAMGAAYRVALRPVAPDILAARDTARAALVQAIEQAIADAANRAHAEALGSV
jgi:hypothetical protein